MENLEKFFNMTKQSKLSAEQDWDSHLLMVTMVKKIFSGAYKMQTKQLIILIAAGVIFLPAPFASPAAISQRSFQ